jgi:hypothetical protein
MRRLVWIFLALAGCGWAQSNNTCNSNGCPPVVFLNYSPAGLPCNNGPQVGYYNGAPYVCSNQVVVASTTNASTYLSVGPVINATNYPNTLASFIGTSGTNDYTQVVTQDLNPQGSASLVMGGDDMTNTTHYFNVSKNGSGSSRNAFNVYFVNADASSEYTTDSELDYGAGLVTGSGVMNWYVNQFAVPSMVLNGTGLAVTDATITTIAAVSGTPTGTPAATGGTVAAGSNYAKIVAIDASGFHTTVSTETAVVTTSTGASTITWNWTAVTGAASYQIWVGATSGTEGYYYTSTTNSYVQTTPIASGTSGTMPTTNTTGSFMVTGPFTTTTDIAGGTKFVIASGCATSATSGGALAGSFTASSTTCSPVITPGVTAPNGFACTVTDMTTLLGTIRETAYSTTQVTFSGATLGSTDQFVFSCKEF